MKAISIVLGLACAVNLVVGCPMLSMTSRSASLSYEECLTFHPKDTCARLIAGASRRKLLSTNSTSAPCQGTDVQLLMQLPFNTKYKDLLKKMKGGASGACALCAMNYNGADSRIVGKKCMGVDPSIPPLDPPELQCNTTATNCFSSGELRSLLYQTWSFIDMISLWAAGKMPAPVPDDLKDKDMCVWSYQSLPPPPPNYRVPQKDARWYYQLCAIATERFQNHIKPGGPVVFGGCSLGKQSIIDACNTSKTFVGMENLPDLAASNKAQFVNGATCSQCDIKLSRTQYKTAEEFSQYCCRPDVQNTGIEWPQAVTVFRVRAASDKNGGLQAATAPLYKFFETWRNGVNGEHKPNMDWVFKSNGGEELGKNGAAWTKGWGAGGPGIRRKVIPCDAIKEKYRNPSTFPFSMDAMDNETGIGIQAEAFKHWDEFCSAYPMAGVGAECTFKYLDGMTGAPMATTQPTQSTAAPVATPALPQIPGTCDWAGYQSNWYRCSQDPKGWFGSNTSDVTKIKEALATKNNTSYKCALAMCSALAPTTSMSKKTIGGVEVSWTIERGMATITATAPGSVWVGVGLGPNMIGGHAVVAHLVSPNGTSTAKIEQYIMKGKTLKGLGDPKSLNNLTDATFTQADGKSVLKFTTNMIAGKAFNLDGTDDLIAAMGSSNTLAHHANRGMALATKWAAVPGTGTATAKPKQDPMYQQWYCEVKNSTSDPTDCATGTKYMEAYSTQQTCLRNADKVYSKARDALYLATPDSTRKQGGTIACQAATQCEKEWLTYYESKVGMTKECTDFFDNIKESYPWSKTCKQQEICDKYSAHGTTPTPTSPPTSFPTTPSVTSFSAGSNPPLMPESFDIDERGNLFLGSLSGRGISYYNYNTSNLYILGAGLKARLSGINYDSANKMLYAVASGAMNNGETKATPWGLFRFKVESNASASSVPTLAETVFFDLTKFKDTQSHVHKPNAQFANDVTVDSKGCAFLVESVAQKGIVVKIMPDFNESMAEAFAMCNTRKTLCKGTPGTIPSLADPASTILDGIDYDPKNNKLLIGLLGVGGNSRIYAADPATKGDWAEVNTGSTAVRDGADGIFFQRDYGQLLVAGRGKLQSLVTQDSWKTATGVTFEQQCPGGKTFPAVAALKNDAVKLLCSNTGGRFVGYGSENVYYIETVDARKGGTSKGYGGNSTTLPPALAQKKTYKLEMAYPTNGTEDIQSEAFKKKLGKGLSDALNVPESRIEIESVAKVTTTRRRASTLQVEFQTDVDAAKVVALKSKTITIDGKALKINSVVPEDRGAISTPAPAGKKDDGLGAGPIIGIIIGVIVLIGLIAFVVVTMQKRKDHASRTSGGGVDL